VLELKLETQARELVEKDAELFQRQEQNDALLTQLAETMEELNKVKEAPAQELEQNLTKRHQSLKD
jgi:hypothetical protein